MEVLAFASAVIAPGCVIPVAPQFEDPEENYPPFVLSSDPSEGSRISPSEVLNRPIKVIIGDQNLGDTLFARWIYDYPGRDPNITRFGAQEQIARTGSIPRGAIQLQPSCLMHDIARGPLQHTLTLSVSDRPFLDSEDGDPVSPVAPLDSAREGAHRLRVTWFLELECK
jgi:hypothetical protein